MNVIIVGGGKVGGHLAALLLGEGHRVAVVEIRQGHVAALERDLPGEAVILGSGTDPVLLEAAGIRRADVVAAVTGEDEVNLTVTGLARFEFQVPRIIARVNNPRNAWMFTNEMGVDVALNQADLMARLIEEEMSLGDMVTLLKLRRGQYSLVEQRVHPSAPAVGKAVREIAWPEECSLAAVIRMGQMHIPRADLVLQPEDEVLAVVHAEHALQLAALLGGGSS
jgi:trk system potassium uptake protein TrkA